MAWDDKIPADERKFYNVTRWSPDTCACVLEFAWDTRTSEDNREHLPADIVHACKHHAHHAHTSKGKDVHGHHHAILGENQHKNQVLGALLEELDDEHVDLVPDQHGKPLRQFKREPRWGFNDKRELTVELDSVPADHCKKISTKISQKFKGRKTHIK